MSEVTTSYIVDIIGSDVISPSQVRRILLAATLVTPLPSPQALALPAVHAPELGQTAHVDLYVPVTHTQRLCEVWVPTSDRAEMSTYECKGNVRQVK